MNFDDYELSDEIKAKIQADYDADIKGLKDKNSELIERNSTIKAENEKIQLDMATIAKDAEIAAAEVSNNVEAYKKALAEKDDLVESTRLEFAEKDNARVIDIAVSEFTSSHVSADPAARKYMESVYRESITAVDGEVKPKDVTKATIKELTQSIVMNDDYKNYIRQDVGSGAGSAGSTSTNGQAKSLSQMTATEEAIFANSQPELYAQMTK